MAELLTKLPTNLTEYPNSFKRQGCFPLEAYSVFYATADKTAFEAAQDYATNNGIAYVGQTLAVVTTTAEDATVVDNVTFYIIADAAGTLQEVGKATNGDGKSIVLTDGILSLAGFEAAQAATLPQKQTDGSIKWVPIDSIVEGDTNTKTVVAAGDDEVHVLIDLVRDDETDTNTYKISLDLSAYATTSYVDTEIQSIEDKFDEAIGAAAEGDNAATGIYAAIEAAEARAKSYADANDADTIYDDTKVKADIQTVSDRVTAIETAIGDDTDGIVKDIADNAKAIADEAKARAQADSDNLTAAKGYTDEEIVGLDITIEKKLVGEVESDYIVIKNKAGAEVASVNAAKFIKDGMLDKAEYDAEGKKLVLTWNTDAGKNTTELEIGDLVDTYTAGNGLTVENNEFAIDESVVATVSALNAVKEIAEAAQTAQEVSDAIDAKITEQNLGQYAKASTVETELGKKVDQTVYDEHVEAYEADKLTFATKTELATKVDTETYTADKAKFAVKTDVEGQFSTVEQRIDTLEGNVYSKTETDDKFAVAADVEATYATKEALEGVEDKADSNTNLINNLTGRLDGIVAQGGEPNVINTIKVNGVAQAIDTENKSVDIAVPVIANTKVSDLKDGQSFVDAVNANVTAISAHDTTIEAIQQRLNSDETGLTVLNTRLAALEVEVGVEEASRIDAIEGILNGAGESDGLLAVVAEQNASILALQAKDTEITTTLNTKANASDVYTKAEANTAIKNAIDAIPEVDLGDYAKTADVEAAIATVNTEVAKKANASDVYTIDQADEKFMTEAQVDARLNTLIDGANSEDTITSVTNLIEFVNDNAGDIAKLVSDVQANADAIAANKSAHEKNASDIVTINDAIAALVHPKASAEISVAEDGTLGINEMNVNKLVQTAGDTLILNGGSTIV